MNRSRHMRAAARRAGILVLILLLPVAVWSLWDYIEARRLERVTSQIRERNEPLRTLRHVNTYVDRPDNAARYYDAAGALLHREALYGTTGILNVLRSGASPSSEAIARARRWLEENAEAERLLDRGTDLEFFGFQPGTDYTLRTDKLLGLSTLAALRALERAEAGDGDGAVRAVRAQLRLGRGMSAAAPTTGALPMAVIYPLSALGVVTGARPSAAALAPLQRAIDEYDNERVIEQAALHMRAWLIEDVWDESRAWYGRPSVRVGNSPWAPLAFFLARPWFAHRVNAEIRALTASVEAARRPWPERLKEAVPAEPPRPPGRTGSVFSADHAVDVASYLHLSQVDVLGRMLALVRSAKVAIAVERYRLAHGELPRSLDALVPHFLREVPIDPYSGTSVKYVRAADGYRVYSVGTNWRDDHGQVQEASRWGGPRGDTTRKALDLGVHNPLTRRPGL